jgi:hypothetical protein
VHSIARPPAPWPRSAFARLETARGQSLDAREKAVVAERSADAGEPRKKVHHRNCGELELLFEGKDPFEGGQRYDEEVATANGAAAASSRASTIIA